MKTRLIICLMAGAFASIAPAMAQAPLDDVRTLVVGFTEGGRVLTGGVPLTSGDWGTDYVTVSHGLRVGRQFAITYDGKSFDASAPVAACSSKHHGIDVLIVRVASHQNRRVVAWGDPDELKAGDELVVLPRPEIHATPERMRFLHVNLLTWSQDSTVEWPQAWQNVMVGEGYARPGFSGSPWVKDGKVYGLHKGIVRLQSSRESFAVAETATRLHQCLKLLHYTELIPKQ